MRIGLEHSLDIIGLNNCEVCNVSIYRNAITQEDKVIDFVDVGGGVFEPAIGEISTIGYRYKLPQYFSGVPITNPINGIPSSIEDRYIANDYNGSYVSFNVVLSEPILHTETWDLKFWVNCTNPIASARIYAEGYTVNNNLLYSIGYGSNDPTKLKIFIRDLSYVTKVNVESTLTIANGQNNYVHIKRAAGEIILMVNGVSETLSTGLSGSYAVPNTSSIGALLRIGVLDAAIEHVWDFVKNTQIIPLNDKGTDIKDASGVIIGSLIDPSKSYWNFHNKTWYLKEDIYCAPTEGGA